MATQRRAVLRVSPLLLPLALQTSLAHQVFPSEALIGYLAGRSEAAKERSREDSSRCPPTLAWEKRFLLQGSS